MKELVVVVEGHSEERFVRRTLREHLPSRLVVRAIKPVTGKRPDGSVARGGGDWTKWLGQLRLVLSSKNPDLVVTTMFDLYGLPPNCPAPPAARFASTSAFADAVEHAMATAIGDPRFLPNILRHEFETLVLAALPQLEALLVPAVRRRLRTLRSLTAKVAPEEINCGKQTAPSKRLEKAKIGFNKLLHGVSAVHAAGITTLRAACPRFGAWIARLERAVVVA